MSVGVDEEGEVRGVAVGFAVTRTSDRGARARRGGSATRRAATLAVYGDSPYGNSPTDFAQREATPSFIASINADPSVELVMHIGDIHSGKQYCTRDYDQSIADLWKQFQDPLIYTPGDNETTDCHKLAEGGGVWNATTSQIDYVVDSNNVPVDYATGDPVANLELIRSLFFPRPGVPLGASWLRLTVDPEASFPPSDSAFGPFSWQRIRP
jgi:hypothetical protein